MARPRHRSEPDPLAAKIGARIRRLRKETNLTFDAFVEATRLGRGYISELERGLVVPTVGALSRVAAVLGVTLPDLVLGDTERERIFDDLREQRPSVIREIRERTRILRGRGVNDRSE
jgi:transcriptional regulator with XRE-family HTH domain